MSVEPGKLKLSFTELKRRKVTRLVKVYVRVKLGDISHALERFELLLDGNKGSRASGPAVSAAGPH